MGYSLHFNYVFRGIFTQLLVIRGLGKVFLNRAVSSLTRVDNKGREESIERAIWSVQDVFGKSRARNSNVDQSERSIQIANSGCGLERLLTRA